MNLPDLISPEAADAMMRVEGLIRHGGEFMPRWGWHDDHQGKDGTPDYLPAMQQVRSEFASLVNFCAGCDLLKGSVLQLGVGECDASHQVWRQVFRHAVTLDWRGCWEDVAEHPGLDIHTERGFNFAYERGPYDLLFVDADHSHAGVRWEHETYGPMVRPGGIVAFHDTLPRIGYPEVEVWRYVDGLTDVRRAEFSEVGVAWIIKR